MNRKSENILPDNQETEGFADEPRSTKKIKSQRNQERTRELPGEKTTREKVTRQRGRASAAEKKEPVPREKMAHNRSRRTQDTTGNQVIDSRYRVCKRIGRGAMGAVYEVNHVRLNKRFALKIIHPELAQNKLTVARFHREASALSRIDHPNCVGVVDFGRTPKGDFYLVMDYVEGKVLAHLVEDGPFPVTEAMEITKQILLGLNHAHKAGIIHRDIKLENVIKTENEDGGFGIKILDFGLAKEHSLHSRQNTITRSGVVIGTPQYIAPETILSQIMDKQTDLYSVGVTLFRMLVGKPIFFGSDPGEVLHAKVKLPAPKLNDFGIGTFPTALEEFLAKALAGPQDRFANASQMLEALGKVAQEISKPESQSNHPKQSEVVSGAVEVSATGEKEIVPGKKIGWSFQNCLGDPSSGDKSFSIARMANFGKTHHGRRILFSALMPLMIGLAVAGFFRLDGATFYLNRGSIGEDSQLRHAGIKTSVLDSTPSKRDNLEDKYTEKGRRLLLERKCRKAEKALARAVSYDPGLADAHKLLGHAQICLKNISKGLASYKKAIKSDARVKTDDKILEVGKRLLKSPQARLEALDFMGNYLGESAQPTLIELAERHPDAQIRHSAMEFLTEAGALSKVEREKSFAIDLRQAKDCDEKSKIVDKIADLDTEKAQNTLKRARDAFVRGKNGKQRFVNECVKEQINGYLAQMSKDLL